MDHGGLERFAICVLQGLQVGPRGGRDALEKRLAQQQGARGLEAAFQHRGQRTGAGTRRACLQERAGHDGCLALQRARRDVVAQRVCQHQHDG